jgi:hypothetical protein
MTEPIAEEKPRPLFRGRRGLTRGMNTGLIDSAIFALIIVAVLFKTASVLVPEVNTAGQALNDTGAPLGSFFAKNGLVVLIIMAALVLVAVRGFLGRGRHK